MRGGRRRRYAKDSRTIKAIAVTPEVWRFVQSRRLGREAFDDTLRRLLGLATRTTL